MGFDDIILGIVRTAYERKLPIYGPAETVFGFGWDPTTTFWRGRRRVNLFVPSEFYGTHSVLVEIADRDSGERAKAKAVATLEETWAILEQFLVHHRPLAEVAKDGWTEPKHAQDELIPDPPDKPTPGNFGSWFSAYPTLPASEGENPLVHNVFLLPKGFIGWVVLSFGPEGSYIPQVIGERRFIIIPASGRLTVKGAQYAESRVDEEYGYIDGSGSHPSFRPIDPGVMLRGRTVTHKQRKPEIGRRFFVGTIEQYKAGKDPEPAIL